MKRNYYPLQTGQSPIVPANSAAPLPSDLVENPLQKYPQILVSPVNLSFRRQATTSIIPVKTIRLNPLPIASVKMPGHLIKQKVTTSPRKAQTASDPDWGQLFLLLFSLFLLNLLFFTGLVAFLFWVANTMGALPFFAALIACTLIVSIALKYVVYQEQKETEQFRQEHNPWAKPSELAWLFLPLPAAVLILGYTGLAFLLAFIFSWPVFWTAIALVPASIILWKLSRPIRRKARRRREAKKSKPEVN